MKRIIAAVLLAAAMLGTVPARADMDISAACGILIEASTGEALFEKNADKRAPIASVTKIMTLLLTAEAIDGGRLKKEDVVTVIGIFDTYLEDGYRYVTLRDAVFDFTIGGA